LTSFDPERPLPGAPEPWAASTMPALRDGPPYAMTEMIAAEPALAERLARSFAADPAVELLARRVQEAVAASAPVTLVGCGTSEHAAEGVAAIWTDVLGLPIGHAVQFAQALEMLRHPQPDGLVVAVSHEGGTHATNDASAAVAAAGATTALITVGDRSPGAAVAGMVVTTGEQDQSWCHTVGYLSPLIAGTAVAARLAGATVDPAALRALLQLASDEAGAASVAGQLARCDRLLVVGGGADHASARELALKLAEGAHLPAMALPVETVLHGHLAAADARTGIVVILVATAAEPRFRDRALDVLRAAGELGMPAAAILAAGVAAEVVSDLTPAGRLAVPATRDLPPVAAALLGSALPLQLLAERMARARGVNPDPIGRDNPAQAAAHG
jgi:glucosamine 6-phosphate synthetase-like amidotransferase/phosphosugar isomerase protein